MSRVQFQERATERAAWGGALTESSLATIYGCCGLFDLCTDMDLMSLSFQGTDQLLDWIGWQATDVCVQRKSFITWIRPEYSTGSATAGYLSDPCGDDKGVDFGVCNFLLEDFARLRRHGPTRDVTENRERLCEQQPRYRLDGSPITNQDEYDMRLATEVLLQDLRRMLINGNNNSGGQFDGLNVLITNNYTDPDSDVYCRAMDSIVLNWNNRDMDGGAGITWNGAAIASTWDLVDVIRAIVRKIKWRISLAPALSTKNLTVGDMVLVMPDFLAQCLLDKFTCWSVCDGKQYNEVALQTYEARAYRDKLNGGKFGSGRIFIDGFEIPIIPYNWGLIRGATRGDIYLLTGNVGSIKLINGQYLDMHSVPADFGDWIYKYTDGGKFLTWLDQDGTCIRRHIEIRPRLLAWAPWASAKIQYVKCVQPGGPWSEDPTETSFFPETSFESAECPDVDRVYTYNQPLG